MSNPTGTQARREEEIAFLVLEQVLEVDIQLADAGSGDKKPDGAWHYLGENRRGIVEVTSPPDEDLMRSWARAKRLGKPQVESGSMPVRQNELAEVCTELLAESWARGNIAKLIAAVADERHLFLFARSYRVGNYFYRLAEPNDQIPELVQDIVLPRGLTDVWFRGRARRVDPSGTTLLGVARYQLGTGWHRYVAQFEERDLPAPIPSIADDLVPDNWRRPKNRTAQP